LTDQLENGFVSCQISRDTPFNCSRHTFQLLATHLSTARDTAGCRDT